MHYYGVLCIQLFKDGFSLITVVWELIAEYKCLNYVIAILELSFNVEWLMIVVNCVFLIACTVSTVSTVDKGLMYKCRVHSSDKSHIDFFIRRALCVFSLLCIIQVVSENIKLAAWEL